MIRTTRLRIIDADLDVWEAVLKGNPTLSRTLGVNVPKNWTENADAFPMFVEMVRQNPDLVAWGGKLIIHHAENLLIGSCGFKGKPNELGEVEIGYEVKKSHREKGLATEAARALVDFAFNDNNVQKVLAHTLPMKSPSTSVLTKLGFVKIGEAEDPDEGTVWRWSYQDKPMIKPFQKDEDLVADIKRSMANTEGFRIWWFGQSGFLIQWQGKHLLFDPYLSDSLTVKYAQTDKPHTRLSERAIAPELLNMIDVVTSSHNHTDHLDAETLLPIFEQNPGIQFVIPEANRHFVCERLHCEYNFPIGLNDNQHVEMKGFTLHGVPAAHNQMERDEHGNLKFMGFVATFGEFAVYHSGDTLWYDGIVETLKPFGVDVAFVPINGNKPERRVAGNLNTEEAARLGKEIAAKLVIPHHYDMFAFNTEDPQNFIEQAIQYRTPHRVLQIGEGISILPSAASA